MTFKKQYPYQEVTTTKCQLCNKKVSKSLYFDNEVCSDCFFRDLETPPNICNKCPKEIPKGRTHCDNCLAHYVNDPNLHKSKFKTFFSCCFPR